MRAFMSKLGKQITFLDRQLFIQPLIQNKGSYDSHEVKSSIFSNFGHAHIKMHKNNKYRLCNPNIVSQFYNFN
jgi:hypothetical protein